VRVYISECVCVCKYVCVCVAGCVCRWLCVCVMHVCDNIRSSCVYASARLSVCGCIFVHMWLCSHVFVCVREKECVAKPRDISSAHQGPGCLLGSKSSSVASSMLLHRTHHCRCKSSSPTYALSPYYQQQQHLWYNFVDLTIITAAPLTLESTPGLLTEYLAVAASKYWMMIYRGRQKTNPHRAFCEQYRSPLNNRSESLKSVVVRHEPEWQVIRYNGVEKGVRCIRRCAHVGESVNF
jgi:hypothetical protein